MSRRNAQHARISRQVPRIGSLHTMIHLSDGRLDLLVMRTKKEFGYAQLRCLVVTAEGSMSQLYKVGLLADISVDSLARGFVEVS